MNIKFACAKCGRQCGNEKRVVSQKRLFCSLKCAGFTKIKNAHLEKLWRDYATKSV